MFRSRPQHDIKRIVVCVDGTWYNADGKDGHGTGNVSNTFRVFASIKQGTFEQGGKKIRQVAKYFHGIGVKTNRYDKYNDGITGEGCKEVIRNVYQYCCAEVTGPNDELWLFGFSRGAYVVRAVSALFRDMATLERQSTGQFQKDYREMLDFLSAKQKKQMTNRKGELYNFLVEKTREGPVIQFLGLFDTVKKAQGDVEFDLSYSRSIRRVRQALAMNEQRSYFPPELYKTDPTPGWDRESIVQAWFVGWHVDIGGGAKDDGLSLYPLQWMLTECQKYHLVLEYKPAEWITEKVSVEHPPSLVLPSVVSESGSRQSFTTSRSIGEGRDTGSIKSDGSNDYDDAFREWSFSLASGITVSMYDLRATHQHGNLQKWQGKKVRSKGYKDKATHRVRLNPPEGFLSSYQWRSRPVFDADGLVGYNPYEPYGTIIHPSVYFLQDTYPNLGIKDALQKFEHSLDEFRSQLQSTEHGNFFPWMLERTLKTRHEPVRILICGRSGVGKSTLLNRIFGVDVTDVSKGTRGVHDIDQGFESDLYPGVVIHDSEGFESGDIKRVQVFKDFLERRSHAASAKQQLHAVWICSDMATPRPIETAMEKVLAAIAEHAPELPVFLVGTKKDEFLRLETDLTRDEIRTLETGQAPDPDREIYLALEREKRDSWQKRLEIDCAEASRKLAINLAFVSRGTYPGMAASTLHDRESIKTLMHLSMEPLISESLRSSMVAAQVVDTDLKIDLAIDETVRLLRTAVTASSLMAVFIILNSVSTPTYSRLLCNAIVRCFGLTPLSGGQTREAQVDHILSSVVWSNLTSFMGRSAFTAIGNLSLLVAAPIFDAPVAARMIVKCACDLIIILDRAFQVGGKHVTRQQLRQASLEYVQPIEENARRGYLDHINVSVGSSLRRLVHRRVNALIPVVSVLAVKIYKKEQIEMLRLGIKDIVATHRMQLPSDHDFEPRRSVASSSDTLFVETDSLVDKLSGTSEDDEDLKELRAVEGQ